MGEIVYYLDRKKIGARDIVTTEKVEKQNYGSALENVLGGFLGFFFRGGGGWTEGEKGGGVLLLGCFGGRWGRVGRIF